VKLTDFGFSNCFAPGVKLDTSCGSLCYSAPEILLGDSYDAPGVGKTSYPKIMFKIMGCHVMCYPGIVCVFPNLGIQ